jgi:ATP-binding cassette, subfamily B, bacterial
MEKKRPLFIRKSLRLLWRSSPLWATTGTSLTLVRSFLPLALIYLVKILTDMVTELVITGTVADPALLVGPVLAVVAIFFADEVAGELLLFIRSKHAFHFETDVHDMLHRKSIQLDLNHFENPDYYDYLARASREAPYRPNSIIANIITLIRASVSIILMTVVLATLHPAIILLVILINIPGVWLKLRFANIIYKSKRDQTPEARKSQYFSWLLTGDRPAREVRLFGLGNYLRDLFTRSFAGRKREETEILRKRAGLEIVSGALKAGALFAALYYLTREVTAANITPGDMAMYLIAFRQVLVYIREILAAVAGLYEDNLFIADLFRFLSLEEKVKPVPPEIKINHLQQHLEVRNLSFRYPGSDRYALEDISFSIKKGELVAIAGPNGSGKSTLVKLLCRLYDPQAGGVYIDDQNIIHSDPVTYRKLYSVVFQDFMLYNMTAGDNIRMGKIDMPDPSTRIADAACKSGVHGLLSSLPGGYDTVLGRLFDESRDLSWGEWQKIALARAVFRQAEILILDEPVSALDAFTEHEIFSSLSAIRGDSTCLLISHRFPNIIAADRIIVLDKGRIAETGDHETLMKKGGLYHKMFTLQNPNK